MYLGIQSETRAILTVANSSAVLCNCFNDPKLLAKNFGLKSCVWNAERDLNKPYNNFKHEDWIKRIQCKANK